MTSVVPRPIDEPAFGPGCATASSTSGSRESPLVPCKLGLCGGGSRSLGAAAFALSVCRRAWRCVLAPDEQRERGTSPRQRLLCDGERSEEHTSELQSRRDLVCRLLL